jgi:hypothetical protein
MIPPEGRTVIEPEAERADAGSELRECVRRALQAAGEFYGGLAQASASALRVFCEELHPEQVRERGLATSWLVGVAQSNARFFDSAADVVKQTGSAAGEPVKGGQTAPEGTPEPIPPGMWV